MVTLVSNVNVNKLIYKYKYIKSKLCMLKWVGEQGYKKCLEGFLISGR